MSQDEVLQDITEVKNARLAVKAELDKKKALNLPIARYDKKTNRVYMEYSDGHTEDVGVISERRRYSERIKKEA